MTEAQEQLFTIFLDTKERQKKANRGMHNNELPRQILISRQTGINRFFFLPFGLVLIKNNRTSCFSRYFFFIFVTMAISLGQKKNESYQNKNF